MDSSFLDLMRQVGDITEDQLEQRWAAVETIAASASADHAVRLVQFAHREPVLRTDDEWFWSAFRADDVMFPIDNAVELHSRLADACVRWRIDEALGNDAHLVRLAAFAGLTPVNPSLIGVSMEALRELPPGRPSVKSLPSELFDETDVSSAVVAGITPATLVAAIKAANAPLAKATTALHTSLSQVTRWAERSTHLLRREQAVTQWLLAGVRADGVPWIDIAPDVVAIDAAAELASIIEGVPQAVHERVLTQAVALAVQSRDPGSLSAHRGVMSDPPDVPVSLLPLAPLHVAHARSSPAGVADIEPCDFAVRYLWERTAIVTWSAE